MTLDNQNNWQNNNESGSAILWILMAVALFAALNFAFSSSTRTSTSTLDDAEATAYANQIIAYGNEVKSAVKRMQLRGTEENAYDFENNLYARCDSSGFINNIPNPNKRGSVDDVLDTNGGAIQLKIFDGSIISNHCSQCLNCMKAGHVLFASINMNGIGTSQAELTFLIDGLSLEICQKINNILGVTNDGTSPLETTINHREYNGDYLGTGTVGDDSTPVIFGKSAMCTTSSGYQRGTFWQTLLTR